MKVATVKGKKQPLLKRLAAFLKSAEAEGDAEAGPLADWAGQEEAEPEHAEPAGPDEAEKAHEAIKSYATKLGEGIAAYGDTSALPENHPVHAFKALHKEMCDKLAAHDAEKAEKATKDAEAEAARKEAEAEAEGEAEAEAEGGLVHKRMVSLKKRVEEAEKRAKDAEAIAKAERGARELEEVRVELRKFRHVPVDVAKEAPIFKQTKDANPELYKSMLEKMNAAEARASLAAGLQRDLGSPLPGGESGAWAQIEAEAAKLVEKSAGKVTKQQAIAKFTETKRGRELVAQYEREQKSAVQ